MRKFITSIVIALAAIVSANAQSIQIHQSYNSPSDETRVLVDYFWSSDNGKWNVFSWNAFDSALNTNLLLYAEREIASTGLYGHLETRYNSFGGSLAGQNGSVQAGFAYLIPWENGPAIFLTPKYFGGYEVGSKGWANDFMFSINSSYENEYVYYEGYFDSQYASGFSCFTEQKAYYKISERFQLGLCGVLVASPDYKDSTFITCFFQPYVSLRISLY